MFTTSQNNAGEANNKAQPRRTGACVDVLEKLLEI
jgi:hypothetical protein